MRCGIFVDAGYLFAQGSAAVAGEKQPRSKIKVNTVQVVNALQQARLDCCPAAELLRIYWYDGALFTRPSEQQLELAFAKDVKLRLGFINSSGQQKGVDSLIVTDLIELARNHAISDAVLLSGDEDLRIGVSIAQSFGVRVHLIGIVPSRGSQSHLLLQEADTTAEWSKNDVERFLVVHSVRPDTPNDLGETGAPAEQEENKTPMSLAAAFGETVDETLSGLADELRMAILKEAMLPREVDGKLLSIARSKLGRLLNEAEKLRLRNEFRNALRDGQAQNAS